MCYLTKERRCLLNILEGVSSVSSLEQSVKSLGWRRIRVVVSLEHFFGLINFRREKTEAGDEIGNACVLLLL